MLGHCSYLGLHYTIGDLYYKPSLVLLYAAMFDKKCTGKSFLDDYISRFWIVTTPSAQVGIALGLIYLFYGYSPWLGM